MRFGSFLSLARHFLWVGRLSSWAILWFAIAKIFGNYLPPSTKRLYFWIIFSEALTRKTQISQITRRLKAASNYGAAKKCIIFSNWYSSLLFLSERRANLPVIMKRTTYSDFSCKRKCVCVLRQRNSVLPLNLACNRRNLRFACKPLQKIRQTI